MEQNRRTLFLFRWATLAALVRGPARYPPHPCPAHKAGPCSVMREPSPPPHGIRRSYWITVARPGCVTRTVTGRGDGAVAAMSAPDDDRVSSWLIACGRMRWVSPISVTT